MLPEIVMFRQCLRISYLNYLRLRRPYFVNVLFILTMVCILTISYRLWNASDNSELCYADPLNWMDDEVERKVQDHNTVDSNSHHGGLFERLPDILGDKEWPVYDQSIFFHETSCPMAKYQMLDGSRSKRVVSLTAREACAIESAALHNTNSRIYVLFASPRYRSLNSSDAIMDALYQYDNIRFRNVNLWTYAKNSPAFAWLMDGLLFRSKYLTSHISDFLRFLTLWRWGGLYLDLDTITLQSMEHLQSNYVGAESERNLAAGVLNFAHDGIGNAIALQCLLNFQDNFETHDWGNNGPGVVTRVLKSLCKTEIIGPMYKSKDQCFGFRVYGRKPFYSISFDEWMDFFDPNSVERTLQRLNGSYVAHFWNNVSKKETISLRNTRTAYGELAKTHCPLVYEATDKYLHYF